jgi:cell division protein FtsB
MTEQFQGNDTPKRVIPPWFIILAVLLLGFALFGDRGVLKVYKSYLQKTELEEKITALEKTNQELREEIDALRNDLKAIENIARRELGMVRPDELIYQFHPQEQPPVQEFPSEENSQEPGN